MFTLPAPLLKKKRKTEEIRDQPIVLNKPLPIEKDVDSPRTSALQPDNILDYSSNEWAREKLTLNHQRRQSMEADVVIPMPQPVLRERRKTIDADFATGVPLDLFNEVSRSDIDEDELSLPFESKVDLLRPIVVAEKLPSPHRDPVTMDEMRLEDHRALRERQRAQRDTKMNDGSSSSSKLNASDRPAALPVGMKVKQHRQEHPTPAPVFGREDKKPADDASRKPLRDPVCVDSIKLQDRPSREQRHQAKLHSKDYSAEDMIMPIPKKQQEHIKQHAAPTAAKPATMNDSKKEHTRTKQQIPQPNYTAEQILMEDIYDYGPRQRKKKGDDMIKQFSTAAKRDMDPVATCASDSEKWWTRLFRFINFLRAIGTTAYGIYTVVSVWNSPLYINLGAKAFLYASLAFLCIDLLMTFIKAFPSIFWICWDVKTWDPFARTFSIWNLVADHELILDVSTLLANIILKIYGFRMGEVVSNSNATDLNGTPLSDFGLNWSQKTMNLAMLGIFCITLLLTVALHTLRLVHTLLKKSAVSLSIIVIVKVLLLLYDLATNSLLLYEVLLYQQEELFELTTLVNIVLAVFAASPAIGLTTNVLVNFPLHYTHIRLSLRGKSLSNGMSGSQVSVRRVVRAAASKTFHPFIFSFFGTYAIFSAGAMAYILYVLYNFNSSQLLEIPATVGVNFSTGPMAVLSEGEQRQRLLQIMVTVNFIVNYLLGVVFGVGYWIYQLLLMFSSIWCVRYCYVNMCRCGDEYGEV